MTSVIRKFNGILPGSAIAIDNFTQSLTNTHRVSLFLLTHFHSDHLSGLCDGWSAGHLLAHPITIQLIHNRFKDIPSQLLIPIQPGMTIPIPAQWTSPKCNLLTNNVLRDRDEQQKFDNDNEEWDEEEKKEEDDDDDDDDDYNDKVNQDRLPRDLNARKRTKDHGIVVVTALPASHCSGSLMYLLDGPFGKVLHTGDCRMDSQGLDLLKDSLQYAGRWPWSEVLDLMIIDSTFADLSRTIEFPSRFEATKELLQIVRKNLRNADFANPSVYMEGNMIGYEQLYLEIASHLDLLICAPPMRRRELVIALPEIQDKLIDENTKMDSKQRILHLTPTRHEKNRCCTNPIRRNKDMIIKTSAMAFVRRVQANDLRSLVKSFHLDAGFINLFYSMHSSRKELIQLMKIFKPRKVIPLTDIVDTGFYQLCADAEIGCQPIRTGVNLTLNRFIVCDATNTMDAWNIWCVFFLGILKFYLTDKNQFYPLWLFLIPWVNHFSRGTKRGAFMK